MNDPSPSRNQLRVFAIAMSVLICTLMILVLKRWSDLSSVVPVTVGLGLMLAMAGCWRPEWFRHWFQFWKTFVAHPIQWMITIAVLALIFVFMILPIGLLREGDRPVSAQQI